MAYGKYTKSLYEKNTNSMMNYGKIVVIPLLTP